MLRWHVFPDGTSSAWTRFCLTFAIIGQGKCTTVMYLLMGCTCKIRNGRSLSAEQWITSCRGALSPRFKLILFTQCQIYCSRQRLLYSLVLSFSLEMRWSSRLRQTAVPDICANVSSGHSSHALHHFSAAPLQLEKVHSGGRHFVQMAVHCSEGEVDFLSMDTSTRLLRSCWTSRKALWWAENTQWPSCTWPSLPYRLWHQFSFSSHVLSHNS